MRHTIHSFAPNSPEWHAHRARHYNASDAAAAMGTGINKTRNELLRELATIRREPDTYEQRRFDDGHRNEAAARPWAEEIVCGELYPITVSAIVEGLPLSASCDGARMEGDVLWEHKSLNDELRTALRAGIIPEGYKPQMEQQLLITGAERCLFMASDGTRESMLWVWYAPDPLLRARLIAAWKQFDEDLANYQFVEEPAPVIAEPVMALPALSIQVNGSISLISNLELFGAKLKAFVEGLNKTPSDDQDFADAEQAIKVLEKAQDALEAAESAALGQTASIDEMRRTVALYADLARSNRLMLEKLVKSRKETIREDIRRAGVDAYDKHIRTLNERLGRPLMSSAARTVPEPNFAGVMKGKKTIASLRDAVSTELARLKIEANAIADRVQINLATLAKYAEHAFLFADIAQIAFKANDDLAALVKLRIAEHKEKEEARLAAERERIRKEEEARARQLEYDKRGTVDQQALRQAIQTVIKGDPSPTGPVVSARSGEQVRADRQSMRPSDEQIIAILTRHFDVTELRAVEWLMDFDFDAQIARIQAELACSK